MNIAFRCPVCRITQHAKDGCLRCGGPLIEIETKVYENKQEEDGGYIGVFVFFIALTIYGVYVAGPEGLLLVPLMALVGR